MLCPRCQIKMTAFFADQLELDRCPKCEGLWLDLGEVERLHGLTGLTQSEVTVAATCPRGHGALRTGAIDRLAAEVCPSCRGAFIPENHVERPAAAVTRTAVEAVTRTAPLAAVCDSCGKRVGADQGGMTKAGFQCRDCQTGDAAPKCDFELIRQLLDSIKVR